MGDMERVLILGCSGAGKSVLARELAAITALPVVHLDRHYWRSGWIEPDRAAWATEVAHLTRQPKWLMDGNFSGTLPMRLAVADTVILLDFPTWVCLLRVLLRIAKWFGRTRAGEFPPGCPERLDWRFLNHIRRYRRDYRPRLMAALDSFKGRLIVFRSPNEADQFVRQLGMAVPSSAALCASGVNSLIPARH